MENIDKNSLNPEFDKNLNSNENLDNNTIKVIEESLSVSKVKELSGRVTIDKTVETVEETIDVPLKKEKISVERVKIGTEIDKYPDIRTIDGKTIIPVVREEIVVSKRLFLDEEIHVTKSTYEEIEHITESIRKDVVNIDKKKI